MSALGITPPLPLSDRTLRPVLLERARQYPIVTLTGPRQSGKTTLCRTAFPHLPWVSLEAPDVRAQAIEDPRGLLRQYPDGALLDEVQRAPDLLSYLQDDVDRRPDARGRWVLTGSHNLLLLRAVSQSLAGRAAVLNLLPLALEELPAPWTAREHWTTLALLGGYPAPLHRGIPTETWLGDYVATYLDRDVRDVLRVGDLRSFERFVRLCAGRAGQLLNVSSLGADAGIAHGTAKAWLSVLEATFVTFTLQPWAANLTTREVRAPKLFFWDTGLLCWLLGVRHAADLSVHPLRGAIFENMIAVELMKQELHRGRRSPWWFYRDAKGLEIDFVAALGSSLRGIEVKSGETLQQEWADGLRAWRERLHRRALEAEVSIVYGGDASGTARGVPARSWRSLASGPEAARGEAER
jgi:predicted AAA+ superfamily ATPase